MLLSILLVNNLKKSKQKIKSLTNQLTSLNEKKISKNYKKDTLVVYKNQKVIDTVFNEIIIEKEKIKITLVDTVIMNTQTDTVVYPSKRFAIDSNDVYLRGIITKNEMFIDTLAVKTNLKLNLARKKGVLFNTYIVYPETGKLQITNPVNTISFKKETKFTKTMKVILPFLTGSFITFLIMK